MTKETFEKLMNHNDHRVFAISKNGKAIVVSTGSKPKDASVELDIDDIFLLLTKLKYQYQDLDVENILIKE